MTLVKVELSTVCRGEEEEVEGEELEELAAEGEGRGLSIWSLLQAVNWG